MNDTTYSGAQILPFTPGGHEDAAGTAIRWLRDRHRKAWRTAFEGYANTLTDC